MLDSTAAVAAEREGKNARQLLEAVVLETGDDAIASPSSPCSNWHTALAAPTPPSAATGGRDSSTSC
jgi:hypothetical protein